MPRIQAQIIADSVCPSCPVHAERPEPVRITTFLVEAPRYILAEFNTHRSLCRNAASSRAIPVERRLRDIEEGQPAEPAWWCANQRGMQAKVSLDPETRGEAFTLWYQGSQEAAELCRRLAELGVHKQIANRPAESFVWWRGLVTGTDLANLFHLRVGEGPDPSFDLLAWLMLRELQENRPRELAPGEWHLPFGERMHPRLDPGRQLEVSAARCARLSYETHDGEFSLDADLRLAAQLWEKEDADEPPDASPFEHQAQAVGEFVMPATLGAMSGYLQREGARWDGRDILWGPLRWWRQWRKQRPNETRYKLDAERLLREGEARWMERVPDRSWDPRHVDACMKAFADPQ